MSELRSKCHGADVGKNLIVTWWMQQSMFDFKKYPNVCFQCHKPCEIQEKVAVEK